MLAAKLESVSAALSEEREKASSNQQRIDSLHSAVFYGDLLNLSGYGALHHCHPFRFQKSTRPLVVIRIPEQESTAAGTA